MVRKAFVTFWIVTTSLLMPALLMAGGTVKQEILSGWVFKQVRGHKWYPATVPGVVHTDLMANRIIEDPFFRLNERGVQWVDKEDWDYRTTVHVSPAIAAMDHVELCFEGLDTYADVYLNDSCILRADNMFRRWQVEVKGLLREGGNELLVRFRSPIREDIPKFDALPYRNEAANDQSENGGVFDRKVSVFARKAGYHYGWDWGPRLVTSGIWRPVYLTGWSDARMEHIHYLQESVTAKQARLKACAEVFSDREADARLVIHADGVKGQWEQAVRLRKGANRIETLLTIPHPKLWWTNGLGEAHLYPFTATLYVDGQVAGSRQDQLGLRELKLVREKDEAGQTFYFLLNGVKVFAKGANYIPQDNFLPRVTDERYEKTIRDAAHANMNMLRIWGGGIYENDIFYDLCDKYGILVWQDFMFACSTYPMTPALLDNIRHEATDNVKRLRNHPSIALWCGNNENHTAWFNWGWMQQYAQLGVLEGMRHDYRALFDGVLPEVVAECDPSAFYWPSSPYAGDPDAPSETGKPNWNPNGDAHYWGVWHGKDSIAHFNLVRARFFSEYGFQSFPEYQSVLKYAPDSGDHDIFSEVMMAHQRGGSHANGLIEWYLLNEYRKPKDFRHFLYMGQLLQGDAIRTAIEAHRRDMPYCMGTLFWQHNDCWPVASWSSRDYYGRWKAQHYFAKKAFAPILVSPVAKDGNLDVYLVSDRLKAVKGTLEIRVMELKGTILFETKKAVTLPANSSYRAFTEKTEKLLNGRNRSEVAVYAAFTPHGESEAIANTCFLSRYKEVDFPKAAITTTSVRSNDGFDVTVKSDTFARGVFLSIEGIDHFFSDNYFDLLPGEPRTIHVTTTLDKPAFDKQLTAVSIRDAY